MERGVLRCFSFEKIRESRMVDGDKEERTGKTRTKDTLGPKGDTISSDTARIIFMNRILAYCKMIVLLCQHKDYPMKILIFASKD